MKVKGDVHYLFIYDIGDEIELSKVEKVMNKLTQVVGLTQTRLRPDYISIKPAPVLVDLGTRTVEFFNKTKEVKIIVKMYEVGSISVTIVVPFDNDFEDLLNYNQPKMSYKGKETTLKTFSDDILEKILESIKGDVEVPENKGFETEDYVTFCISQLETKQSAKKFVEDHKKIIAGILSEEKNIKIVSEDEVNNSLKYSVSYYEDDVVLTDWSTTIIIDPDGDFSDQLLTIELVNLQLLSLRYYDSVMDNVINDAYDGLKKYKPGLFSRPGKVLVDVIKKRMEIGEIVENATNIAKFFGDWYLGKIYSNLTQRLHLADWERNVNKKLETLEEIYDILANQVENNMSTFLEFIIVVLIVIEIVLFL